jgi:hypothetical protein
VRESVFKNELDGKNTSPIEYNRMSCADQDISPETASPQNRVNGRLIPRQIPGFKKKSPRRPMPFSGGPNFPAPICFPSRHFSGGI